MEDASESVINNVTTGASAIFPQGGCPMGLSCSCMPKRCGLLRLASWRLGMPLLSALWGCCGHDPAAASDEMRMPSSNLCPCSEHLPACPKQRPGGIQTHACSDPCCG